MVRILAIKHSLIGPLRLRAFLVGCSPRVRPHIVAALLTCTRQRARPIKAVSDGFRSGFLHLRIVSGPREVHVLEIQLPCGGRRLYEPISFPAARYDGIRQSADGNDFKWFRGRGIYHSHDAIALSTGGS